MVRGVRCAPSLASNASGTLTVPETAGGVQTNARTALDSGRLPLVGVPDVLIVLHDLRGGGAERAMLRLASGMAQAGAKVELK